MSLKIDVDQVARVLIAGTWYDVKVGSFNLDSYEYIWWSGPRIDPNSGGDLDPILLHGGGQYGVCANGFAFIARTGRRMSGPLTAIQAVEELVND